MPRTTFKQKSLLLLFSFLLLLVLLEAGLRIAGAFVLYLQESHNHLTSKDSSYRILCLGESTTALGGEDSYPSQLEKMLNAQNYGKKFTVINKGIISTTTDYILAHADGNLEAYKPQLVIVMMGINDNNYPRPSKMPLWLWRSKLFLEDLRVYKLVKLLSKHLAHYGAKNSISEGLASEEDHNGEKEKFFRYFISNEMQSFHGHLLHADQLRLDGKIAQAQAEYDLAKQAAAASAAAMLDFTHRCLAQGRLEEARSYLDQSSQLDSQNFELYEAWGEFYLLKGSYEAALIAFKKEMSLDPQGSHGLLGMAKAYYQLQNPEALFIYSEYLKRNPSDYWGYIQLAQWFVEKRDYVRAQECLVRATEIQSDLDQAYLDLGRVFDLQAQYKAEEEVYLQSTAKHPGHPRLFHALGEFYHKQGKEDLAAQYFKKSQQMGLAQYSPWTLSNYDLLLKKIWDRKIKVIVMQYPLRGIEPLKEHLGARKDLFYIENRQNFKEALESGQYSDYFSDTFAADFGHCTRRGNQLIAKNLFQVILTIEQDPKGKN